MPDNFNLYNGKAEDNFQNISDGDVQCVITSPPYFNAKSYETEFKKWEKYDDYLDDLRYWIRECFRVLEEGRMFCINTSPVIRSRSSRQDRSRRYNITGDVHAICRDLGFWFQEDITWVKPEGAVTNRNQRFSVDRHPLQWRANPVTESILVYQKPTDKLNGEIIKNNKSERIEGQFHRSDLWEINPDNQNDHPASFPIEIPHRLIKYYTWTGDIVLDPFMGSGTTGVAALNHDCSFIGIEISQKYCNMAMKRIGNETYGSSHDWW